ncbi:hypothetical protein ACFXKG_28660 [Streptomyces sp. NPDC059255]|uniref:hypothetical protein n=1 Tax=Streptomyces sp. NPDC059255 TaxID=3346793 RepID=UPI003693F27F
MRVDPHRQPHAQNTDPPPAHLDHPDRPSSARSEEPTESDLPGADDMPDEEGLEADGHDGRFEPL